MNLKKCSDEKLARLYKNKIKRRDEEMQDYNESSENSDFEDGPECDDVVLYQCQGCGDEWEICISEDGVERVIEASDETCRHCGARGVIL